MSKSKVRSFCARLIGMRYRELPFGTRRDIEVALSELEARKCGESGSPAFEVNDEYFRIGRRKLRVCTEDEMFVSLWGSSSVVDQVYTRVMESWEARRRSGV